jgi:hypothetical protein
MTSGGWQVGGGGDVGTHAPFTSVVPCGQMHWPGIAPGSIGVGQAQMLSTFGTCGGGQTGGVGGHAPPTGGWPFGQVQMPSTFMVCGAGQVQRPSEFSDAGGGQHEAGFTTGNVQTLLFAGLLST